MEKTITITSDNSKHTLEITEDYYKDMLEDWGVDMKKFARNFLNIKAKFTHSGRWSVTMTHNINGDYENENNLGFVFYPVYPNFEDLDECSMDVQ